MTIPVMSMNYTMNRTQKSGSTIQNMTPIVMPFNNIRGNVKSIVGLEIKPSKAYKGCGSCGRG